MSKNNRFAPFKDAVPLTKILPDNDNLTIMEILAMKEAISQHLESSLLPPDKQIELKNSKKYK